MHTILVIENDYKEDVIIVETHDTVWTEVTEKTLPDVVFTDEGDQPQHPQWENGYTWSFRYTASQLA
ncbi:MAG: hypothetical protein AAF614_09180 [Chloroflexota bacterium]